jgi:hypothetical protein
MFRCRLHSLTLTLAGAGNLCTVNTANGTLCRACHTLMLAVGRADQSMTAEASSCGATLQTATLSSTAAKRLNLSEVTALPIASLSALVAKDAHKELVGSALTAVIHAQEFCNQVVDTIGPHLGALTTSVAAACTAAGRAHRPGCIIRVHADQLLLTGLNSSAANTSTATNAAVSAEDCVTRLTMYTKVVSASKAPAYTNDTLREFCLSMELSGLEAISCVCSQCPCLDVLVLTVGVLPGATLHRLLTAAGTVATCKRMRVQQVPTALWENPAKRRTTQTPPSANFLKATRYALLYSLASAQWDR